MGGWRCGVKSEKIKSNLQFRKYLGRKIKLLPEMLFRLLTVNTVDDGARKSNNWLDQWQSDKLDTGSRV